MFYRGTGEGAGWNEHHSETKDEGFTVQTTQQSCSNSPLSQFTLREVNTSVSYGEIGCQVDRGGRPLSEVPHCAFIRGKVLMSHEQFV